MHSARALLAISAASAALVLGAPGAYAVEPDRDHEESSYSQDHGSGQEDSQRSEDTWGDKEHGKEDTWGDKEHQKEDSWSDKEHDKEHSWKGDHEKPTGGMHTGGGGLAGPTVTAGGLAVLAVAGTGLYAARRRKSAGSVA
ncbi:hypothetical protein ACFVP3_09975 [Streptomyces sp. NPDC057806]|uniref:hypothetical protein n=1 Tax=unclassified Streptomyces TaxID=2593676 RepID=UPI00368B7DA6